MLAKSGVAMSDNFDAFVVDVKGEMSLSYNHF